MSVTTSPEFFINMKSIPTPDSEEYEAFFANELEKIENGVTINGVFIDPWLYWHLNHWHINIDIEGKNGEIKRRFANPDARDNEWEFAEVRREAKRQKKGLIMIGIRRFAKSEIEASIIARSATINQGSENVISGGNDKDIKLITDKCDRGLNALHEYFRFQRVEDDWKKQITLGIRKRSGERMPFSYILIRNYDDGLNTEAAAGITAVEFIIDEIGKFAFLRCLEAAIPSFTSPFGWRCSPLLVGTGGAFEKGADAEKVFHDPDGHNMLGLQWREEPKKFGFFAGHNYRMETKVQTTIGEYVESKGGILLPKDSELFTVPLLTSDWEAAEKYTDAQRERAKKANDSQAYLKEVMYFPKNPMECFLTLGSNFYSIEPARQQKAKLLQMGRSGTPVFLEQGVDSISHRFSDKGPISNFPAKAIDDKDAPIIIWEYPIEEKPPFGLYVAGVDPYKQDQAKYSDSLGAVYIYKRMHDIKSDLYQDMFVASYVARPKSIDRWNEQARLLIKYYNARTLCENEDMGFINYMIYKGDGHYLEDQPGWLKEIVPNTEVNRPKGIHRSAYRIRMYLHTVLKQYLDEKIGSRRNDKDEVVGDILGVTRVLDTMFLEEIIKFTEDLNCDREVAASLAIALARHLDPQLKVSSVDTDPRLKAYWADAKKTPAMFSERNISMFPRKHKLF